MNLPMIKTFRLLPRGEGGLACDKRGVALGAADLVRASADAAGRRRWETAPPQALARVLSAAYGPQDEVAVDRVHRGLKRAASALEAGDLCLAGIETVLLALPDPTPSALEKLAEVAKLQKWGTAWENQPRLPAGQPDGGQWTTADAGGAPAVGVKPASADQGAGAVQAPRPPLDDGVYRPGRDDPHVILTGGPEARGSNGPPEEFTRLEQVFPGFDGTPGGAILAPIDGFFGVGAAADEANLEATMGQYWRLVSDIKQVDPSFVDQELLPEGGIAGLTWPGRTNLINGLRMERAAAYYRVRGDVGPLQVETLRFLQDAVDSAYADAVSAADAGRLQPRLSRAEAIGNSVDVAVRKELMNAFDTYGIRRGPRENVTINNRDYETTDKKSHYRLPDARIGDVAFDWSLSMKTIDSAQIRGFFRAGSRPRAVIIVRPSQLDRGGSYLIPRPDDTLL